MDENKRAFIDPAAHKQKIRRYWKAFSVFFIVSVLLELTVFNFRHYDLEVLLQPTLDYTDKIVLGSGMQDDGLGLFYVGADGQKAIEIPNINQRVTNAYLRIIRLNGEPLEITLYYDDEMSANYTSTLPTDLVSTLPQSFYKKLSMTHNLETLIIQFNNVQNEMISIQRISFNEVRPLYFLPLRVLFVFLSLCLIWLLRPGSEIYKYKLNLIKKPQVIIICAFVILQTLLVFKLGDILPDVQDVVKIQYEELTKALRKGQFHLDITPPQELLDAKNGLEQSRLIEQGRLPIWDILLYEGKHYTYFGVVPVLLFYLPYHLITNQFMPYIIAVRIMSVMLMLGIFGLVHQICKRWFSEIPFALYFLISVVFVEGSGMLFFNMVKFGYQTPILMTVSLSLAGLYFWMSSIREGGQLSHIRLCLGSLCMALVAGSRPHMLVGSLLAVPIFWPNIKSLFTRSRVCIFVIPYIVIGSFIMFYNYARFGSVFEFGVQYMLGMLYLNLPPFLPDKIGFALWSSLLQPARISNIFPFIHVDVPASTYRGSLYIENYSGGILSIHLLTAANYLVFKFRKILIRSRAMLFVALCIVFGMCISIFDANIAATMIRYAIEFQWFFYLSSIIIVCILLKQYEGTEKRRYVYMILLLCMGIDLINSFAQLLDYSSYHNIRGTNFYMALKYVTSFWM